MFRVKSNIAWKMSYDSDQENIFSQSSSDTFQQHIGPTLERHQSLINLSVQLFKNLKKAPKSFLKLSSTPIAVKVSLLTAYMNMQKLSL